MASPMNHPLLVALLVFALSSLVPMIFRLFRPSPRDKARSLIEYVQRRGFVLVNPAIAHALDNSLLQMTRNPALRNSIRAASDVADIEGLENITGDWLAFICTLRSKEVTIFNCSTSGSLTANSGPIPYKVAKIKAQGLPRFSLGKNSIVHTVQDVVGRIVGEPKVAIAVDPRLYPDFAAHYWIRGSDATAISAFLSPQKLRFIETANLPGILASNPNYLVYFEDGTLRSEPEFDSFIATVEKVIAGMF